MKTGLNVTEIIKLFVGQNAGSFAFTVRLSLSYYEICACSIFSTPLRMRIRYRIDVYPISSYRRSIEQLFVLTNRKTTSSPTHNCFSH